MPLLPCLLTDARGLRFNNGRGHHVAGYPILLREIETLRNKIGTNSWSNFAGCWLVAVNTRILLVAVFIQMLTIIFVPLLIHESRLRHSCW